MNWWVELAGYIASALVFLTFCMKTMIPLRIVAIVSNVAFIVYGFFGFIYPVMILHVILLPLNIIRTRQMLRLIAQVKQASRGDLSLDWLKPYMKHAELKAGDIIFSKGDTAEKLYVIVSGEVLLEEIGVKVGGGAMLGEIAFFAPDKRRTQTARCQTDVDALWIDEKELAQVCYQNPAVSFHLLRLITARLIENARRVEAAARPAALA